jgi:Asp-tRNA(Asn)/Glu-tRNA(Gln) amidotransferase A subunit family amidase
LENRVTRRALLTGTAAAAVQIDRAATASDPLASSLRAAAAALAKRRISSEELTKLCLALIAALDVHLNTFLTLDADSALAQARACETGKEPWGGR